MTTNPGCPRHPQAYTWRRALLLLDEDGTFSCCAICGDPLDSVLRKALNDRLAQAEQETGDPIKLPHEHDGNGGEVKL
jgi:hypothetical protein